MSHVIVGVLKLDAARMTRILAFLIVGSAKKKNRSPMTSYVTCRLGHLVAAAK